MEMKKKIKQKRDEEWSSKSCAFVVKVVLLYKKKKKLLFVVFIYCLRMKKGKEKESTCARGRHVAAQLAQANFYKKTDLRFVLF